LRFNYDAALSAIEISTATFIIKLSPKNLEVVEMLLDLSAVADWLGTDQPTILALLKSGYIPRPIILGSRLTRWSERDLEDWSDAGCPEVTPPTEAQYVAARAAQVVEDAARDN
jgi:predicted DNA-binding transcriptional regulator AlpA